MFGLLRAPPSSSCRWLGGPLGPPPVPCVPAWGPPSALCACLGPSIYCEFVENYCRAKIIHHTVNFALKCLTFFVQVAMTPSYKKAEKVKSQFCL